MFCVVQVVCFSMGVSLLLESGVPRMGWVVFRLDIPEEAISFTLIGGAACFSASLGMYSGRSCSCCFRLPFYEKVKSHCRPSYEKVLKLPFSYVLQGGERLGCLGSARPRHASHQRALRA